MSAALAWTVAGIATLLALAGWALAAYLFSFLMSGAFYRWKHREPPPPPGP